MAVEIVIGRRSDPSHRPDSSVRLVDEWGVSPPFSERTSRGSVHILTSVSVPGTTERWIKFGLTRWSGSVSSPAIYAGPPEILAGQQGSAEIMERFLWIESCDRSRFRKPAVRSSGARRPSRSARNAATKQNPIPHPYA